MRFVVTTFLALFFTKVALGAWSVGIGKADTTGPAAGIGMMGYAKPGQNTAGIHTRLYSRAFIFDDGVERAAFVSVDMGMMGQLVKKYVIEALEAEFGQMYRYDNVILSGTHTHSGPAGYLQYILFDVTCLGFVDEAFQGLVAGITESIRRAHNNMQPAFMEFTQDELHEANINRSPTSYLANPEDERAQYEYDTDHLFSQLNIMSQDTGLPIGVINWFAVHPVSMNNTNHLISSDNKGRASMFVEEAYGDNFVAAFASTNLGDVSPNLNGPKCIDTGLPCDAEHSTCDGRNEMCQANGPGENHFESTFIIGQRQSNKALDLLSAPLDPLSIEGSIQIIHQWINMSSYPVVLDDGSEATTCPAALGYAFAAGCTDGPGAFDFVQGTNDSNPFWDFVSGILKDPSPEQEACHAPKPILLDTGEIQNPYQWHPDVVDTQIVKLGDLIIAAMPGEFTTMSGRRMRKTLYETALANGAPPTTKVVLAGLSNVYTHYIATFEEYQRQRYEAASTLYGPHTLRAYQKQYSYLLENLLQISFVPDVHVDFPANGTFIGQCIVQPPSAVPVGSTVVARFQSGHPRNDLLLESSFFDVEFEAEPGTFVTVHTDADWETKFHWHHGENPGESEVEVVWEMKPDTPLGNYRLKHRGVKKNQDMTKENYEGVSQMFSVVQTL